MVRCFALLLVACHAVGPAAPTIEDSDARTGLAYLNILRHSLGLSTIVLDADLCHAATLHANYLALNTGRPEIAGLLGHHEDLNLPGASREGALAGANSVIAYDNSTAPGAIDEWLATFYHRIPLLGRDLTKIGIGHNGLIHVLTIDDVPTTYRAPVLYPFDGQPDVPAVYAFAETPEPRPAAWWGTGYSDALVMRSGYPITIAFDPHAAIADARAELRDPDGAVEIAMSSPSAPATSFPQGNVIAILPRAALAPGTTYRASVTCTVDGRPAHFAWTFTTVSPRPFDIATEAAPPFGTPIAVTGVVSSAYPTQFCDDREMKQCKEHITIAFATKQPADRRIELDLYNAGPDRERVLALVGKTVHVSGLAAYPSAHQVTIRLDGASALFMRPAPPRGLHRA